MNEQEAINILKCAIKKPNTEDGYLGQSIHMAISALEKQIPKKPLKRLCGDCQRGCIDCDRYEDRCPNCNGGLYVECGEPHKHCPHCGQKLDWSENS